MSSPYPVLGNRPIDNWKVTELKEELKRRKLPTKGLKEDLIKRLDEAIRVENEDNEALLAQKAEAEALLAEKAEAEAEALRVEVENAEKNLDNGVPGLKVAEPDQNVDDGVTQNDEPDDGTVKVDSNDSVGEVNEGDTLVGTNSDRVEVNVISETTVVETVTIVSESVVSEVALGGQDLQNQETEMENGNSKPKQEDEGIESTDKMVMPESPPPNNQVSEVSSTLGSQVKSDSISTDSMSINEKIELKGNIIADNVKIELDVVKPSSNVDPFGGESHPMDVEEPHKNKTAFVEGEEDDKAANTDLSKKNDSVDVGYSEKLNLDRSSGDDSMEEDLLETRQIDSKDSSDDVVVRGDEKTRVPSANEEASVDIVGDGLSLNKDIHVEAMKHTGSSLVNKENPIGMASEKRKLNDQEAIGSAEPLKRQRRWNSENVKVPESQSPNVTPSTTPKNAFQPTALKRNFSMSDSKSKDDAPKERVVPPSQKPPTNSLRIDHFLRPFTLKAVQELLGKTGTVAKFWMDQIKTHCFVTYSSVEEATETRNAVYNLQWPPNGGRLLVAEFVDPQEVTTRADAPQAPAAPVKPGPTAPPAAHPVPPPHQPAPPRHQPLPLPPPLLPPREQLPLPPPPPPPLVTLDDIFRKTRATPRIYYLPLSEAQVNAKLAALGKKQDA